METGKDGPTVTTGQHSAPYSRTKLQTIEDFMKEQDDLDSSREAQGKAHLQGSRSKNPKKPLVDAEVDEVLNARASKAVEELRNINWVGRLQEYRAAHPTVVEGLTYAESIVGQGAPRFTCTVVVSESSQHFGGGGKVSFLKKKDAKQYASKKAVDWLVDNKYMPADGTVKFPKVPQPPAVKAKVSVDAGATLSKSMSFASQVPEVCIRLGFNTPTYDIKKASENAPLWNGFAHFGGDPRIEGKIGEVRDVFGKNNAKEKIAEEVLSFLKDIERQRGLVYDEDRKRKRVSESSETRETVGNAVKVAA